MKVHELAKTLKISSKDLLDRLKKMGVDASNHLARLDEATIKRVKLEMAKPAVKIKTTKAAAVKTVKSPSVKALKPAKEAKEVKPEKEPAKKIPVSKEVKPAETKKPVPPPVVQKPAPRIEEKRVEEKKAEERKPAPVPVATAVAEPIRVQIPITVGALAVRLNLRVAELIKSLMAIGVFANVNQLLSEEIIFKVASQLGISIEKLEEGTEKKLQEVEEEEDKASLKHRPPVVTLMGHVDHGKTSLLDAIRKTNVAAREAGQITQHIGAYSVDLPGKGHVAFLDTPGHEAFTAMRARGANATDIVVLVIAADDGVMPQTIEAIDHAREAEVPIVVAINKCDHPQANPQRVMMQLQKIGVVAEEWGGKSIICKVSAKTGEGIEHLLEMLLLEAEVLELKANPDQLAQGVIIEGRLTKGSGAVATVIVQKGTLRVGDVILVGPYFGKVRALRNDRGKNVKEAGPAYPVEVLGLGDVPRAGENFRVIEDEKEARHIAEGRLAEIRAREQKGGAKHLSLENLHQKIQEGSFKELKLIIKADVQGSIEALGQSLEKLSTEVVRLHVIHGAVGGINESDVMLAAASDAVILGFHVKADTRSDQLSQEEGVDIRFYNIIYEAVEDVRKAMEGLLEPVFHEVLEGRAAVRKVFRSSKAGTVGGAMVNKGKLTRSSKVRLLRNQKVVLDGKLSSLKRFKDDVKEVLEGYEFGFVLEGFSDIQEGDLLEAYRMEKGAAPKLK